MNPAVGAMPTIEWALIDNLSVDDAYQRTTENNSSQRLIRKIAENFDWRLFGVLAVSRRPDDSLKIIDGQHRWSGARLRGDIPQVPCCINRFENAQGEAKLFIEANRARKAMNRLDDFHAALAAADREAILIERIVTDAELTVARTTAQNSWGPGEVAFTSSIRTALSKHGEETVATALRFISEAFPDQVLTHGGSIFTGIVGLLTDPPIKTIDPDRLFQALLAFDINGWGDFVDGLRGGKTRSAAMKDALFEAYRDVVSPERAYGDAVDARIAA